MSSQIGNTKWQDMIPNIEVLKKCNMPGIEALLLRAQLRRWCGYLVRMKDDRIPRAVFYGQLKEGSRTACGQKLCFKDTLKSNMKSCNIDISNWESYASDRSLWRSYCKESLDHFEDQRLKTLQQKRQERKTIRVGTSHAMFVDAPARHALVFGDTSKAINEFGRVDHSLHRVLQRNCRSSLQNENTTPVCRAS